MHCIRTKTTGASDDKTKESAKKPFLPLQSETEPTMLAKSSMSKFFIKLESAANLCASSPP